MPKFAANITMLFTELPFIDRIQAAKSVGFTAVECLFPYAWDVEDIATALNDTEMELALFNLPAGNWDKGDRGIAALTGQEDAFMQSAELAFEFADRLDCKKLHMMSGIVEAAHDKAHELYKANLAKIAPIAKEKGITLLIEPLNQRDVPGYLVSQTEEAAEIINQLGFDNIKLQFDIYHRQIMQGNVVTALREFIPLIGHIQIAGVPDRHEPDRGELNYPALFDEMDQLNYTGWVGCEYNPKNCTIAGLNWLKPYIEQ